MSDKSLAQWLAHLETLHPKEMDLGLERVAAVARALDLLPVSVPVITVAGTNGKGSTIAVLEAVLGATGKVAGVCTSPHFLRFNERIRIAGQEASDSEIVEAFEQIDAARNEISLTYFEFSALAALVVFRARDVDVAILEVGLGGRLDAVNIVDSSVAVITSIDLDHQNWLGDTRELIAIEKAGIYRTARPAVIADLNPPATLLDCAAELGTPTFVIGKDFTLTVEPACWRLQLCDTSGGHRHIELAPVAGLLAVNVAAALQALSLLPLDYSDQQLAEAVAGLHLSGRQELQTLAGREYLLDVAHNPAAVDKLLEFIELNPCAGRTIALFSVMEDKDIHAMIRACSGHFGAWFIADQPANPRAAKAKDLASELHAQGEQMISCSKNIRQAYRRAQSLMAEGDRLVIFGSFFTVADVLPLLDKDRAKAAR